MKFTPYILNGAGCWEYIPGGEWFADSIEEGFRGIDPVAEDGDKAKIVAFDEDENEIEKRIFEIIDGKMVEA